MISSVLNKHVSLVIANFAVFFFVSAILYNIASALFFHTCQTELQAVEKQITEKVDKEGKIEGSEILSICGDNLSADSYKVVDVASGNDISGNDFKGQFYGDTFKLYIERTDFYLGKNHTQNIFVACQNNKEYGSGYDLPSET